ncbi:MAG TPA: alpha/beta hydrolase-fold protein [Gemmatimonadaceae bacterium]|nr:alpha/beta hydrolase-fold protein [Gemmatimonadaceae bacterium]
MTIPNDRSITRRQAITLLGALSATPWIARAADAQSSQVTPAPRLAPGAPSSSERMALIEAFKKRSGGIPDRFEARSYKSDWTMPYRLFKPAASGTLPLVIYLHGSGGLGDDNVKQMGLGNIFGTRVWAMPEYQKEFPCYVLAPQTDRGWVRYGEPAAGETQAPVVAGLGDGARVTLELIAALRKELPIDERRMYLTGQSMGGAGVWHMLAQRPGLFAAAAVCCGSASLDDPAASAATPVWNFHGDADATVPVAVSRARLAARRKAGGHPVSTEYAGVGHNAWEWAYTEPALVRWMFGQKLST